MIIGISGKKQSGKDTTASMIVNDTFFGGKDGIFIVKRFADKFKDIVCLILGCTREELENNKFKERALGEEWVRNPTEIEIWEIVEDFPNYKVSSFGNIKNIRRDKFLKQTLSGKYLTVKLYNGKERKTFTTHQLVMSHFSNYDPSGHDYVINHIDNDQENNHLSNLEVVSQRYNVIAHKNSLHNIKKYPLTPRLILQLLGTEGGRKIIHNDTWVNALFADYKLITEVEARGIYQGHGIGYAVPPGHGEHSGKLIPHEIFRYTLKNPKYPNWVIPDVRFPNEARAIKKRGGLLIRVNRDTSLVDNHASETALDDYEGWDCVIDNNGTIEDLKDNVMDFLVYNKLIDVNRDDHIRGN